MPLQCKLQVDIYTNILNLAIWFSDTCYVRAGMVWGEE